METAAGTDPKAERGARLYRMLWRWHFYAGMFCIPFVIALALSGSVYLFRPQIEAWIDRDLVRLERTGSPASMDRVAEAAVGAVPGSKLAGVVLREAPDEAVRILVADKTGRTRVYVHPDTLAILKVVPEEGRFERLAAHLHGELLSGNVGSVIVELAASWAIMMVLTGLYLWWPRTARGLGGVLYPRLGRGRGMFWRDLHAVTGVWVSGLILFLLITGLPWAFVWGGALKQVRSWAAPAAMHQDWGTSSSEEHAEHMRQDSMASGHQMQDATLDTVVRKAEALGLAGPVILTPPSGKDNVWWAKSNAQNRPQRRDVALSRMTGEPVQSRTFDQKALLDQIIGVGTAAHEGQLFGPLNQVLGLLTAAGLITLSISAFIMWRKRAPDGTLGAPPTAPGAKVGFGLAAMMLVAAVLLPVLGASLLFLCLLERVVLMRLPGVRRWLGLTPA